MAEVCRSGGCRSNGLSSVNVKGKRKKTNHQRYIQKFKSEWITEENKRWLTTNDKKEAVCKVCDKVIIGGITHVKRHGDSENHQKKLEAAVNTVNITTYIHEKSVQEKLKLAVKKGEIKLVMFIAEHNLPFILLEHLPQLIRSICNDSKIAKELHCSRKKGTNYCTQIIAPENLNIVSHDLKNEWFTLIIDETTDISTDKCLAIIVARYFKNSKVRDKFLGLVKLQNGTAEGIFSAVKNLLQDNGVSFSKLLGFAADNASVRQGNLHGVQARFKEEVPDIFVLGCTCHSLALCSSAACKKLPDSVEALARDIVSYFSHSTKHKDELKECQVFAELKPHKMLKLCQVRWLSLQNVVDRILEQWSALRLFFTSESYNSKDKNKKDKNSNTVINPQKILEAIENAVFKLYFSFLSYVLATVNKINIEFQSEAPRIHLLYNRVTALYRSLLKNFVKRECFENNNNIRFIPCNYKDVNNIYCGANCELIIQNNAINKADLDSFKISVLNFYIELCKQIQSRFNFDDPVLQFLKNFDPSVVTSGGCESLVPLAMRFPRLVKNIEQLNSEWRMLSDIPELKERTSDSLDQFWAYIIIFAKKWNR